MKIRKVSCLLALLRRYGDSENDQGRAFLSHIFNACCIVLSTHQCTASCGVGMQMRNVMCAEKEGAKILRILPNDQCSKDRKMKELQKCSVQPCQAGWYIYPWESVRNCPFVCCLGHI